MTVRIRHVVLAALGICILVFCILGLRSLGVQGGGRGMHYKMGGAFTGAGPSVTVDQLQILFSSPKSGNGDIYRVGKDGDGEVRLTNNTCWEYSPASSPKDGSVVFCIEENGEGHIWLMNSDGTNRRRATVGKGDEGDPRFSRDGDEIIFWREVPELKRAVGPIGAREVFVLTLSTGVEERITKNTIEDSYAELAPDARSCVITRDGQLWLVNRHDKSEACLGSGWEASFSEDGEKLVFVSGRFGREIAVMDINGSNRKIVYAKNTPTSHPVFFDEETVLFLEAPGGRGVGPIVKARLDGSGAKVIADTR